MSINKSQWWHFLWYTCCSCLQDKFKRLTYLTVACLSQELFLLLKNWLSFDNMLCYYFFKTIELISIKFRTQLTECFKIYFDISRNMALKLLEPGNKQYKGLNGDLCNGTQDDFFKCTIYFVQIFNVSLTCLCNTR